MRRATAWLWIGRLSRWFIGGVFVYAGLTKAFGLRLAFTTEPYLGAGTRVLGVIAFRDEIRNYQLGPLYWLVHPSAIVLPWMEIVAGLALVFGFWAVEAATLIAIMIVVFNVGVGSAMYRGLDINCGCFGTDMKVGWLKLAQNTLLLGVTILAPLAMWRAGVNRRQAAPAVPDAAALPEQGSS